MPRISIDWTNDAERRLADIEELAAEIEEKIQWLLDQVEKLSSPLLMPIRTVVGDYFDIFIDAFRARIDLEIELIRRLWESLKPALEESARCAGNPTALEKMARMWTSYEAQFDELADSVSLQNLATDDRWIGLGATAYTTAAQAQYNAIDDLTDDARSVSDVLQEHAAAIVAFEELMDNATDGFRDSLAIAGIGAAATLAGLPLGGWPAVVAFVLGVIATAASIAYAFFSYFNAVNTANTLFDREATAHEGRLSSTELYRSADWPVFAN